jgi:type IV pilus assembly protein PilC
MPVFEYEGIREGRKVRGSVEAGSRLEALSKIRSEGIRPVRLEERRRIRFRLPNPLGGVSEEDLALLLFQIQVLLESGVPLTEALRILSEQAERERVSSALAGIRADLERGETLSSAFRRSGLFPQFLPEMLTAAETGRNLEKVFRMAGEHLRTVARMKGRVVGAVVYPAFVVLMSLIALVIAVKFVVPRVAGVLEGMGRELPLATRAVLLMSDLLTYALYLIPPLLLALLTFGRRLLSEERLEALLLRIPAVGKVLFYFDLSRFAYTLHMTLSSAVPVVTALRVSASGMSLKSLRKRILELTEDVERGRPLHWVFRRSGLFPPLFVNLTETGERSGELERMFKVLGDLYRQEALRMINLWTRMIEPLSILILGLVVGLIALSVILPLTEVTSGLPSK